MSPSYITAQRHWRLLGSFGSAPAPRPWQFSPAVSPYSGIVRTFGEPSSRWLTSTVSFSWFSSASHSVPKHLPSARSGAVARLCNFAAVASPSAASSALGDLADDAAAAAAGRACCRCDDLCAVAAAVAAAAAVVCLVLGAPCLRDDEWRAGVLPPPSASPCVSQLGSASSSSALTSVSSLPNPVASAAAFRNASTLFRLDLYDKKLCDLRSSSMVDGRTNSTSATSNRTGKRVGFKDKDKDEPEDADMILSQVTRQATGASNLGPRRSFLPLTA